MLKDQRTFFRIDVMMPCSYRILDPEEAQQIPLPERPDAKYIEEYFMKNLSELDKQINEVIGQINHKSTLLAAALTAMNTKINFLLQTVDEKQLARAIPQRLVNLSGSGIAIEMEETIQPGQKVDLLIKPLVNEAPIFVRCDVVTISPCKDGSNRSTVALVYQKLTEDDRRKLVYFIQAKEIEYAQAKRREERKKRK